MKHPAGLLDSAELSCAAGAADSSAWLLDVDDTLLDTAAAMRSAAPGAVHELDSGLSADEAARIGAVYCDDPDGVFQRFASGALTLHASRGERLASAYRHCGVAAPEPAADVETWGGQFERAFAPRFLAEQRVFDDVEPTLARALGSGIRVGLVTNASELLTRRKLRMTRLAGFPFVCVVTRDTLGFGKPDPRVFQHAAALVAPGEPLSSVLYVGDALEVDAQAAEGAGLTGVLLERTGSAFASASAEVGRWPRTVRSLAELLPG